ncbi:NmrA-like family protein [Colletotrichum higginsianum IMI 349063]|uniref:NmrA-like family protein n=3 Tax=Colletotrichum higginsianum TaxID=80884 RepID=A0A1B7YKD7_COLHI|nr:NmrA-like family protein [Colletotrichum higginsianum IMI 349063]OBR12537.1 NmrA-like family protein [Colletotrichum higginsianum IMI 349063]
MQLWKCIRRNPIAHTRKGLEQPESTTVQQIIPNRLNFNIPNHKKSHLHAGNMSTFKNVALLGKGYLGSAILKELVEGGFNVTVLGRSESTKDGLPDGVGFKVVDFASIDSLTPALQGQDAVVSTVSKAGLLTQPVAIDACIKAGVKRYIPSDWGSFTTDPKAHSDLATVLGPMFNTQKYVIEKARAGEIEYTIFSVGGFIDLFTRIPVAFDFANKSIIMYDDGVHPFSITSIASIGKAVVGALKNPDATKNRNLKIHELLVSQAQLLALAKKLSPPGTQWKETKLDGKTEWENALKAVLEDPYNETKILEVIKTSLFSGRYESAYGKVDNELVGVPLLTEKDLEEKMAAAFSS